MSGAELKKTVRNFVEGYQGGFNPFNRGSLPVVSGISVEIKETEDGYTLSKVTKNEKPVQDEDTFTVTFYKISDCLFQLSPTHLPFVERSFGMIILPAIFSVYPAFRTLPVKLFPVAISTSVP